MIPLMPAQRAIAASGPRLLVSVRTGPNPAGIRPGQRDLSRVRPARTTVAR